ncbi:hypothetical protein FDECE_10352 [Fusarium decemcellulare]|nr:hypothetical protein FDECE_10352 [Fusarium decemcellulare]
MSQTPRLSPELLRLIFQYLCPHCCGELEWPHWPESDELLVAHQQDSLALFHLCLVSRQFRDIAEEILYHQFNPYYTKRSDRLWGRRLEPFLRTIATRPDLARSVKAAFIRPPLFRSLDVWLSRDAFGHCARAFGTSIPELWEKRKKNYPERPVSNSDRIIRQFFTGVGRHTGDIRNSMPFLVAPELITMLVALLPNLCHLKFEDYADFISTATASALGLTKLTLKTLDMSLPSGGRLTQWEPDEAKRPLTSLIHYVPDLETLITYHHHFLPESQNLKTLCIRAKGRANLIGVQRLLPYWTGQLSAFSFTDISEQGFGVDEKGLIKHFDNERFRPYLKSLHLDVRYQVHPGHTLDMRGMPSFKPFTHLETLFIATYSLYNTQLSTELDHQSLVSILPSSIISLTLVEHDKPTPPERLREGLLGLAKAKPTLFEQLKKIRCDSKQVYNDHLKDAFEGVGVDFGFHEFPRRCWSYSRQPLPMQIPHLLDSRSYPYLRRQRELADEGVF